MNSFRFARASTFVVSQCWHEAFMRRTQLELEVTISPKRSDTVSFEANPRAGCDVQKVAAVAVGCYNVERPEGELGDVRREAIGHEIDVRSVWRIGWKPIMSKSRSPRQNLKSASIKLHNEDLISQSRGSILIGETDDVCSVRKRRFTAVPEPPQASGVVGSNRRHS